MTTHEGAPWRALRDLEPSLGSKRRVLANIYAELDHASARKPSPARTLMLAVAAIAAVAALWLTVPAADRTIDMHAPLAASAGTSSDEASAGARLDAKSAPPTAGTDERERDADDDGDGHDELGPELRLSRGDRVAVDLRDASVTVIGPAAVRVGARGLVLHRGRVSVDGTAVVRGAICDASVSGSAEVEATASGLQVSVFAGSAEVTPGVASCAVTMVDLDEPASPPEPKRAASAASPTTADTGDISDTADVAIAEPRLDADPAPPSALRQQVEAFRRARGLSGADALAAWRGIVERWSDSPLREEADAAIIDVLVTLGRTAEARSLATAFAHCYPSSPRARGYRTLGEQSP